MLDVSLPFYHCNRLPSCLRKIATPESFSDLFELPADECINSVCSLSLLSQTVSENASLRDRVEFLQEASVMK